MNELAWISLLTLWVTSTIALAGGGWKIANTISARFTVFERELRKVLDDNSRINQARHEENIQRLTRLETLAVKNGSYNRKTRGT